MRSRRIQSTPVGRSCVIGVDLGGTNVRAGAFYEDGSPAGTTFSNSSRAQDGADATLAAVAATIQQAGSAAACAVEQVALAIPGHIDDDEGLVRWAPNFGQTIGGVFEYWTDVQVRGPLERMTGLRIRMGNDANLAALGEYKFGSGKNSARCLVMLTLGTGIGGGVVMASSSVQGNAHGSLVLLGGNKGGAELGHTVVNYQGPECNSGEYGSLESYLQRDALVHRAQHRLRRGRTSILTDIAGDISTITPKHLSEAAEKGDEVAREVFEEAGTMLGVGIANFINIFAPDIVAIGGQIALAGELLLAPAVKTARNVAIPSLFESARILIAEQLAEAGMLGAVALASQYSFA